MNKFIIFALLFVFVLNQTEEEEEDSYDLTYTGKNLEKCIGVNENEANEKNCNSITLDEGYNCCYLTGKDDEDEYNMCLPLNESEEKKLKEVAEEDETSTLSIKCSLNTNVSNDSSDSSSSSYNYINKALIILLSLLF